MKGKIPLIAGGAAVVCLSGWLWYWHGYGGRAAELAESSDPQDRLEAVRELRGKWGPLARRTLTRLPDDPDSEVARWAVRALGERPDPANRRLLEGILASSRPGVVRAEAASALGKYPDTNLSLLTGTLGRDPDPAVREGAATGLAARRDVGAVEALLERLEKDPDLRVRKSSFLALRRILKVRFMYTPAASAAQRRRQVETIRAILRRFQAQ
jgi:HEAT repeat protein